MSYALFILFFLLILGVVSAEATWLTRKSWTTAGRAWTFVLATDLIGFGFGFFVSFAIFSVMLMMVFGPAGQGSTSSEGSFWLLTIVAVLFPPVVLVIVKRIFLVLFAMRSGKAAWLFSFVAGFGAAVFVALPPPVLYYFLSQYAR